MRYNNKIIYAIILSCFLFFSVLAIFLTTTFAEERPIPNQLGTHEVVLTFTLLAHPCQVESVTQGIYIQDLHRGEQSRISHITLTNIGSEDINDISISATNWKDKDGDDEELFEPYITVVNNNLHLTQTLQSLGIDLHASNGDELDGESKIVSFKLDLTEINDYGLSESEDFSGSLIQTITFTPEC